MLRANANYLEYNIFIIISIWNIILDTDYKIKGLNAFMQIWSRVIRGEML